MLSVSITQYDLITLDKIKFQKISLKIPAAGEVEDCQLAHFSLDFHFYIQWAPLNVITMGPKETDDINRMITIIECIMQAMSELGWSTFIKTRVA